MIIVKLRPFTLLTGSIHIEGGEQNRSKQAPTIDSAAGADVHMTVIQDRVVTPDRRKGNTLVTNSMRDLKPYRLLKTPFGTLVEPTKLAALQKLVLETGNRVAEFNDKSTTCKLFNCILLEPLRGIRQSAIEGWLSRRLADGDPEIRKLLPRLKIVVADAA